MKNPLSMNNDSLNAWIACLDLYAEEVARFAEDYPDIAHDFRHLQADVLTAIAEDFYPLCIIPRTHFE